MTKKPKQPRLNAYKIVYLVHAEDGDAALNLVNNMESSRWTVVSDSEVQFCEHCGDRATGVLAESAGDKIVCLPCAEDYTEKSIWPDDQINLTLDRSESWVLLHVAEKALKTLPEDDGWEMMGIVDKLKDLLEKKGD